MLDRPSASELLEAIAAFITEEARPALEGPARFHALVAANVARIVAREIELAPALRAARCRELWTLLGRSGQVPPAADHQSLELELASELCARIEAGDADEGAWRSRVLDYLRAEVAGKLAVDNPAFRKE